MPGLSRRQRSEFHVEALIYLIIALLVVTLILGIVKKLLKLAVFCAAVLVVISLLSVAV